VVVASFVAENTSDYLSSSHPSSQRLNFQPEPTHTYNHNREEDETYQSTRWGRIRIQSTASPGHRRVSKACIISEEPALHTDPAHPIHRSSLSAFFQLIAETIQIEASQIILMNPLGSQLTQNLLNSIIHHSTQDQSSSNSSDTLLYAFDRQFLSADPSEALNALACQPEHLLQPKPPPFEPSDSTHLDPEELEQLTLTYHQVGANHLRTSLLLLTHVRAQKSALEVALNNLDKCREPPQGALEAYETFAHPLVQDYGQLLEAFGPSFALAKRVKIHPALLPSNALLKSNSSQSVSNTGTNTTTTSTGMMKVKYMGDYVMEDKILQIRDKCLKVYGQSSVSVSLWIIRKTY
jgi:hypothetical protein